MGDTWPEPISVSERLPDDRQYVFAFESRYCRGKGMWLGACLFHRADKMEWIDQSGVELSGVTFWMPCPPNPVDTLIVTH